MLVSTFRSDNKKVESLYPSPKAAIQNVFFIPTNRKIWLSLTMQQGFYLLRTGKQNQICARHSINYTYDMLLTENLHLL